LQQTGIFISYSLPLRATPISELSFNRVFWMKAARISAYWY